MTAEDEATNSNRNTSPQTPRSRFPWLEGVHKDAVVSSKATRILFQQAVDILPIQAAAQVVAKANTATKKIIPQISLTPMTMFTPFSTNQQQQQQIADGHDVPEVVSSQKVEGSLSSSVSANPALQPEPVLPRDETLHQNMQIILSKTLYGVSMEEFYTTCWSDSEFTKNGWNRMTSMIFRWESGR